MVLLFVLVFGVFSFLLFLVRIFRLSLSIYFLKHVLLERSLHFCLHSKIKMKNRNQLRLGSARQLLSEFLCGSSSFCNKELDIVVSL